MKRLLQVSRAIDALNERFARIATWLVLACCVVSAGNAVSRYLFDLSSNAWLEIQWYMFGAIFMLGASYTLNRNGHVRVDVLYGRLPTRVQIWIDLLGSLLFLLPATVVIGWMSWPMFYDSFVTGEMSGNAGGLARWPVKLMLPLGFALLTLQGASEIIKRAAMLTGELPCASHYERPLQ